MVHNNVQYRSVFTYVVSCSALLSVVESCVSWSWTLLYTWQIVFGPTGISLPHLEKQSVLSLFPAPWIVFCWWLSTYLVFCSRYSSSPSPRERERPERSRSRSPPRRYVFPYFLLLPNAVFAVLNWNGIMAFNMCWRLISLFWCFLLLLMFQWEGWSSFRWSWSITLKDSSSSVSDFSIYFLPISV